MARDRKVDEVWNKLEDKYNIVEEIKNNGSYKITADAIKEFREPRLVTKFDTSNDKPKIFKDNKLDILPDTRGTYIIGEFSTHTWLKIDEDTKIKTVNIPPYVETYYDYSVTSESNALNIAYMSGMIDNVLNTTDKLISYPTLSGRMGSGSFDFKIRTFDFHVEKAQIEIDGSFENGDTVGIIEAKSRVPLDFNIRQLYYQYRVYSKIVSKDVLPIFFTYSDDIYSFHIYKFKDEDRFDSLRKIGQNNFVVNNNITLNMDEVKKISKNSKMISNQYTFPQANSMTRIISNTKDINDGTNYKEMAVLNDFANRQGQYYLDALAYLGFMYKSDKKYYFTDKGKKNKYLDNSPIRNKIIIEAILSNDIFKKSFDLAIKNGCNFDKKYKEYVEKLILEGTNLSKGTPNRRASTVISWIRWIIGMIE